MVILVILEMRFSPPQGGQKLLYLARTMSMDGEKASEYGLRPRDDPGELPLARQSSKVRGVRAAFDILKGNLSPRSAKNKYQVGRHAVKYYKAKLIKDSMEAAATPAAL